MAPNNSDNNSSSSNSSSNSNSNSSGSSNNIDNSQQFQCPYCPTIYFSQNLISQDTNLNKCEHLLLDYQTVSHLNATYRTVSDLTGNLLGNKIPLVIAKRFIKFIRDTKSGGVPNGFYTIHKTKARVSHTFQGVTSFSLRYVIDFDNNNSNNNNSSNNIGKTTTIESTYYLTQNPIQDSTLFESFVLKNYIDSIPSLSTKINSTDCLNNEQQQQQQHISYIGFTREQIKTFLEFDDQDENYSYDYANLDNNGEEGTSFESLLKNRWILITGLPSNQLPIFVNITLQMLIQQEQQKQISNGLIPIALNVNNNNIENNVNIHVVHPLPNIAIQS
ncbi:hypothetical protein DICPUDRAFT_73189 [Dictyostelium purpureum]|uniref:Uncharacterized protein n=1 Tax=Dictyostelium purpureum TaxID=5786 RepID=F0ZWU3_DICPU|nr:uncharacterized protein DICPUDRAFT_73189 [Dictyostelium purpureum]EGC31574.1 hypothetical protein DICPUDRAFT_73189 [Dictyostelium purpureum]|eukprot:XP_003291885.1 hypothetical protein DICPUDRAFT_73189 [Dictyostelium purpureum]